MLDLFHLQHLATLEKRASSAIASEDTKAFPTLVERFALTLNLRTTVPHGATQCRLSHESWD